jgi:endonuclease YncB( thermonuclease family)
MRSAIVAALLLASVGTAYAASISGRVTGVADGDTLTIQTDDGRRIRIRLQGIDAPERTQTYSQVSRSSLQEMTAGQRVTFDVDKFDRHGRSVAVVRLSDGTDVGLRQIKAGLAWHFKRYELEQSPEDRAAYAAAEAIAKAARRGLWRDGAPVPPWEYRATLPAVPIKP